MLKSLSSITWRACLVPAAGVIPAPLAYITVTTAKKLVVVFLWRTVVAGEHIQHTPASTHTYTHLHLQTHTYKHTRTLPHIHLQTQTRTRIFRHNFTHHLTTHAYSETIYFELFNVRSQNIRESIRPEFEGDSIANFDFQALSIANIAEKKTTVTGH